MRKFNRLFIVIVSLISLLLISNLTSVKGASDITYIFNRAVIIDYEKGDSIDQSFNLRNETYYNSEGVYEGTYSFENEPVGTSGTDISWVTSATLPSPTNVTIESTLDNHGKILNLSHSAIAISDPSIRSIFGEPHISGTIEFWWATTDNTKQQLFQFRDGVNLKISLLIDTGTFHYHNGVGFQDTGVTATNNMFFHIRVVFNCTTDTYDFYLNGVRENLGDDDFFANADVITTIQILLNDIADHSTYIDAVGYSWDSNYDSDDNILPRVETKFGILEVSRFEFAFEGPDDFYEGSDVINGWDRTEVSEGFVTFVQGNDPLFDRELSISCQDGSDTAGIEKHNVGGGMTNGIFLDFEFDVTIIAEGVIGLGMDFLVKLYSDDETLVSGIRISEYGTGLAELSFVVGESSFSFIRGDLVKDDILQFQLRINYEIDIAVLRYSINGTFIDSYTRNLSTLGKVGLNDITILLKTSNPSAIYLDNWVHRNNGSGFVSEWGYMAFVTDVEGFNPQRYNLLFATLSGSAELGTCEINEGIYLPNAFGNDYESFVEVQNFENESFFFNMYNKTPFTTDNPVILVYFIVWELGLEELKVEGVKITDDENTDLQLTFDYGNVSITESYFYVDSAHRLQFKLITNDTNLEYIEASFNIPDIETTDLAVSFTSIINDNGFGFMRYKFETISDIFSLSTILRTRRVALTQNETLTHLIILITDVDIDSVQGLTSGYVERLILISTPNIYPQVLTFNLIEMMIPLIIILIPTIAISGAYSKKLITPLFLFMSIIIYITGMIPTWLMFIIGLSISLFMFIDKNTIGESKL